MKTVVKTLIVAITATLPLFSNVQNEYIELLKTTIPLVIIFGSPILIVFMVIQYYKIKNRKYKELIEKIIDKECFNSSQTDKKLLELLLQQNTVLKYSKFITDATISGIGLGIIISYNDIIIFGLILFYIGLLRLIIRIIILIFDTKKNKNIKKDEATIETVKTIENDDNKTVTIIESVNKEK